MNSFRIYLYPCVSTKTITDHNYNNIPIQNKCFRLCRHLACLCRIYSLPFFPSSLVKSTCPVSVTLHMHLRHFFFYSYSHSSSQELYNLSNNVHKVFRVPKNNNVSNTCKSIVSKNCNRCGLSIITVKSKFFS